MNHDIKKFLKPLIYIYLYSFLGMTLQLQMLSGIYNISSLMLSY
jgi:hypothetical protein